MVFIIPVLRFYVRILRHAAGTAVSVRAILLLLLLLLLLHILVADVWLPSTLVTRHRSSQPTPLAALCKLQEDQTEPNSKKRHEPLPPPPPY